jgi:phytoene synthase
LPAEKKRAAFALYAFCRVADDMVDRAIVSCDQTIGRQLETYHAALDAALAGAPSGPVFRELAWSVRTFGVPPAVMHELIAGVTRDLSPVRYQTWDALAVYCEGVASTVGEMHLRVRRARGIRSADARAPLRPHARPRHAADEHPARCG